MTWSQVPAGASGCQPHLLVYSSTTKSWWKSSQITKKIKYWVSGRYLWRTGQDEGITWAIGWNKVNQPIIIWAGDRVPRNRETTALAWLSLKWLHRSLWISALGIPVFQVLLRYKLLSTKNPKLQFYREFGICLVGSFSAYFGNEPACLSS
jgi:hypothetical protein